MLLKLKKEGIFEVNGKKLLDESKIEISKKNLILMILTHTPRLLVRQIVKRNDSWAIRWYASAFLKDNLTLYPGRSLVFNIGLDASGTHSGNTNLYDTVVTDRPVKLINIPIEENIFVLREIEKYFRMTKQNIVKRIFYKIIRGFYE